jgi:UDP-N-acetyl-D-mannosaminuronate dehydrogenase
MVRTAREINDRMPEHVVTLVTEALNQVGKTVQGSQIAVLGAAYKPNIRDIQLTPIKRAVDRLKNLGAWLRIYDPMYKGEEIFGEKVPENAYYAVDGADCIVLGTAHNEFKELELNKLARLCHTPSAFVDTRNVFEPAQVKDAGFAYRGVGRS